MAKQATKAPEKPASKTADKQAKKSLASAQALSARFLFGRRNYMFLFIGLAVLAVGFLLMMGGAQPADQFNTKEIYSFRRTTLSTIFVTAGFLVVLYSIFAKHENQPQG